MDFQIRLVVWEITDIYLESNPSDLFIRVSLNPEGWTTYT